MTTPASSAFALFKRKDHPNIFADSIEGMCAAEIRRVFACSNASDEAYALCQTLANPTPERTFDFDQENGLEVFPDGSLYERSNGDSTVWATTSDFRQDRLRDEALTAGLRDFFGEQEPEEAGKFRITERRFFYGPLKQESWAESSPGSGEPIEFAIRKEAQAWITETESGTHHLANNESGRPEYIITPLECEQLVPGSRDTLHGYS